jgi:drug/metabolite transporter (DMT)-like permease
MTAEKTAYLKALVAVTAWGGSFIATKVALADVLPVTIVWLRFAMGIAILLTIVIARKQFALPKPPDLAYFALLGFLGITFHQWLQSTGLLTALASTTAWIVATTPIFMAILGWLVLREKLAWLQVVGIVLAAVGVLLVVSNGDLAALYTGRFGTIGDVLVLISAVNWAVFSVLSRRGLQEHSAGFMMLYVMIWGWLFTTVLLFAGPGLSDIANLTTRGWSGVIFLGVIASGLAYVAWYDGLQILPSARIGAFLYLEPLVAVVAAGIILSEPVLLVSLLGGGIILAGVWLVQRYGLGKAKTGPSILDDPLDDPDKARL